MNASPTAPDSRTPQTTPPRAAHSPEGPAKAPSAPPPLRRNVKNDVFCDLFSEKGYLLELYSDLHPEDAGATEDDLEIVTMDRVVTNGPYNDLGFIAGGRLVVLVEAQSTWSPNIATRLLLYLAETYRGILEESQEDLYGGRLVRVPAPELYVVYTGEEHVPAEISFARDVTGGAGAKFDFTIAVITGGGEGIVDEYVEFAKRADVARKSGGDPRRKARNLLDSCIADGILETYLRSRYKEVGDIMFTLFEQEKVWAIYEANLRKQIAAESGAEGRAEGLAEGKAEGRAEGLAEGIATSVKNLMVSMQIPAKEAMDLLGVDPEMREKVTPLL